MCKRYGLFKNVRYLSILFLLVTALLLVLAESGVAVEEGRPSFTAQAVCAFRAIGSHDPDPKVRNPDHLAEKMLGPEYWDHSGLAHDLREMKAGRRPVEMPVLHWITGG